MLNKERYLRMSIKRQIVFGMTGLSLGSSFLLMCLIAINCYCFVSKRSLKMFFFLQSHEDETLNSIVSLYDISLMVALDDAKNKIQFLRNIKLNLYSNPQKFSYLTLQSIEKFFKEGEISPNDAEFDCLNNIKECYYYFFNLGFSELFIDEMRFLTLAIPALKVTLRKKNSQGIPFFRKFQFTSAGQSVIYFFPLSRQSMPNSSFGFEEQFENSNDINDFFDLTKNEYLPRFNDLDEKTSNFTDIFLNNPIIFLNLPPYHFHLPYLSNQESFYYIISIDNSLDYNYLQLELQNDYYDLVTREITEIFPEITVITVLTVTKTENANETVKYVGTATSCRYFQTLQSFFSNNSFSEITYASINECMTDKGFIQEFENHFSDNYTDTSTNPLFYNYIKQAIVPLSIEKKNMLPYKFLKFKIFKIYLPVKSTRGVLSSNYYSTFLGTSYFFKSQMVINLANIKISHILVSLLSFILIYVYIFWVGFFFIVYFKSIVLANEITKPFTGLIEEISVKRKKKDTMKFKYDKDINDLFHICDLFVRGGVGEEARNKKKERINCYNNISLIKTNNLIIDEKAIFSREEDIARHIFDFGKKNRKKTSRFYSALSENMFNKVVLDPGTRGEKEFDLRELFEIKELGLNEKSIAKSENNELYEKLENVLQTLENKE